MRPRPSVVVFDLNETLSDMALGKVAKPGLRPDEGDGGGLAALGPSRRCSRR